MEIFGQLAAYGIVAIAVLIVALGFDVLDPAKRRARRERRDAYRLAQARRYDEARRNEEAGR